MLWINEELRGKNQNDFIRSEGSYQQVSRGEGDFSRRYPQSSGMIHCSSEAGTVSRRCPKNGMENCNIVPLGQISLLIDMVFVIK